jgi:hypothetical protein
VQGRKTLIIAGTAAGLVLGGSLAPEASLAFGAGAGVLVWIATRRIRPTAVGFGEHALRVPPSSLGPVTLAHDVRPPAPRSVPSRTPSDRIGTTELDHLAYAEGLLAEADLQGLVDPSTADRIRGLIEARRVRVNASVLSPAPIAPPAASPIPSSAGPTRNAPAATAAQVVAARPTPRPSPMGDRTRRVRELIASDVAMHGLAYLGVLLLFAGAFGFTLFSFNTVGAAMRPVAEIGVPSLLLGSAWFLRRRRAPVVATGLGLIGGLLLPVMLFASFVDGVAYPPELDGNPLVATLAVVSVLLAIAYAGYSARHPDASLRYIVAPMAWAACWALGLVMAKDAAGGIDLRDWSAGQLALVSAAVAVTAAFPRLQPRAGLSAAVRISVVPGIAIAYGLTLALAASEGWPPIPVAVAGLSALAVVELLADPARTSDALDLLESAILGVTASALVAGLGPGRGGAATAVAFLIVLGWQERDGRGAIARLVSGVGVGIGLSLSVADPWTAVAAFGVVSSWAHVRRLGRSPGATVAENAIIDLAAALLPLGAAWGLVQALPLDMAFAILACAPLAIAAAVRLTHRDDVFYAWWTPAAAVAVIAGTAWLPTPDEPVIASAVATLAIATSPWWWPAATVWATAAAGAWTAHLGFQAAHVAAGHRSMAMSATGFAVVLASSIVRRTSVGGHVAAIGTLFAVGGLVSAETETALLFAQVAWCAAWLLMVVDQERGSAPLVALTIRLGRGLAARAGRGFAAVPALVLATSLPFLVTAIGRHVDAIATHRSWSGVVFSGLAIGYAIAARMAVRRRPLAPVLAGASFAVAAVGIAVAAPDLVPSIQAVSALIVAVIALGGALRKPVMTWTAWGASAVLALLISAKTGGSVGDLPLVVLAWGAASMLGGLALDDVLSGPRTPGQGVRQTWLVAAVALGALAVPVGLAFLLTGPAAEAGWWALVGACFYLVAAIFLRAGAVSAVSYALTIVGIGALTPWSILDRPDTGAVFAAALVGASLIPSLAMRSRDPWLRWDLAPLVVAHGVAIIALARSLDVGGVPATWVGIGAVSIILAAVRRNPSWAVAGAVLILVGAWDAGPGWLALALGGGSAGAALAATRSHGVVRLVLQATSMICAAGAWSQFALWAAWPLPWTATFTALLTSAVAVSVGLSARWAGLRKDWAAALGGLSLAGGMAVAVLGFAPASGIDPHTGAELLATVWASIAAGSGLAARPLGELALRHLCVLLSVAAGALLGYGEQLEPAALTAAWSTTAVAATVGALALWRSRPGAAWTLPLGLLGASAGAATIVVAGSAWPRRDLLEVAFLVLGIQAATAGIVLRRPEPLYVSCLLLCSAWLLFASESLAGEVQWFTVPIGIALLSIVAIGRAARRHQGLPPTSPELLSLEFLGMTLVVGAGLAETVVASPERGLFAMVAGIGLAAWGALTRIRRRVFFGACAVVLAVTLMLGGPIARMVPNVTGPALWITIAATGVVLIALATGLERGRATVAATIRRLDSLMEGWE